MGWIVELFFGFADGVNRRAAKSDSKPWIMILDRQLRFLIGLLILVGALALAGIKAFVDPVGMALPWTVILVFGSFGAALVVVTSVQRDSAPR